MFEYLVSFLSKKRSDVEMDIPYTKSKEEVHDTAQKLLDELASKYDVTYQWLNPVSLVLERSGANGTLDIMDNIIEVRIDLKWWARPFKGKIVDAINEWVAANPL